MLDCRALAGGLIVSCQADPGTPLDDPDVIAAIAEAAVLGGARAIRANHPAHVAAIRARVPVPIVGLWKRVDAAGVRWITPSFADAQALAAAGADVIAIDATLRPRPGEPPVELIGRIHAELGRAVMADIDEVEAARVAAAAGADLVATTLAGYTPARAPTGEEPDLDILAEVVAAVDTPVVAEGRFRTPEQVREAYRIGALAVTIGGAITDPTALTRWLAVPAEQRS